MAEPFLIRPHVTRHSRPLMAGAILLFTAGCLPAGPSAVSPEEIPDLERQIRLEPRNADRMLRYAAALFAAAQCDSATTVARLGARFAPDHALAPTVIGQCMEQASDFDQAIVTYENFVTRYPNAQGVASVRARIMLTRRARANAVARQALAREAELTAEPTDLQAVAVLPLSITGDSIYHPLGRGLAQMLMSDLALLQQFRLVERLQIGALLGELALAENTRFDPATTARVGRLVRAGRMVQGLAVIPPDENVSLEANVVLANGEVSPSDGVTGRLRDLLRLEKELVIAISAQLGYQVSPAERERILENGTQNLIAFLAYSNGLIAEDLGDYPTAAFHFSQAVQSDPGFTQAREQYEAATLAPTVQAATAGDVTTVSAAVVTQPDAPPVPDVVQSAVNSSVGDVAATQAEQTTQTSQPAQTSGAQQTSQSTGTSASQPNTTTTSTGTTRTITGTIRIIFKLP